MRFWPFANMEFFGDYRQFVILVSVLSATEGYCKYFSLKIQKLKSKFTKIFAKFLRITYEGIEIRPFTELFHQYYRNLLKMQNIES